MPAFASQPADDHLLLIERSVNQRTGRRPAHGTNDGLKLGLASDEGHHAPSGRSSKGVWQTITCRPTHALLHEAEQQLLPDRILGRAQ